MASSFNSITGKPIQKSNVPQQYHNIYDNIAKRCGNPKTIDNDLERNSFADYIRKEVENGKLKKEDYIKITGFYYLDRKALSDVLSGKKVNLSKIITK